MRKAPCIQPVRKKIGSSRKVGGANKGLGEAPKSCTRKEHESATNSIAKRGQGAIAPCRVKGQRPLWGLGQRPNSSTGDQYAKCVQQRCRQRSVPCGVWGNAPTVPRQTNPKEAANKGAGSEASLPVTLRVRRRAPKLLFPQDSVKNLKKAASLLWKAALFVSVDLHFSGIDLYCGKPSPSAMANTFS